MQGGHSKMRSRKSVLRRFLILLGCLSFLGVPIFLYTSSSLISRRSTTSNPNHRDPIGFVPIVDGQPNRRPYCEDLFLGTPAEGFEGTDPYLQTMHHIIHTTRIVRNHLENSTYDLPNETPQLYRSMQYIAVKSHAVTSCITGFNLGQAALNLLAANRRMTVHAFRRPSAVPFSSRMEEYLNEMFGNRLFVYDGNTVESIPKFISTNAKIKCDLILIAGPLDYHVTKADLTNLARITNLKENYVIFADHLGYSMDNSVSQNGGTTKESLQAWKEGCSSGMVEEKMYCRFKFETGTSAKNRYRGFAVGVVVRT